MRRKEIILEEVLFYLKETDWSLEQIAHLYNMPVSSLCLYLENMDIAYNELRLQRIEEVLKKVDEIRDKYEKKKNQECIEIKRKIVNQEYQIVELKEKLKYALYSAFISVARNTFTDFNTITQEIGRLLGLSSIEVRTFLKEQGVTKKRFNLGFYSMTEEEQKEFLEEEARVEDEKTKTKILKLIRYSKGSLQDISASQHVSVEEIKAILQEKGMSIEDIRNGVYDSDLNL